MASALESKTDVFLSNGRSIAAINCCGFQSKIENGIFDVWASNHDIIIVTETKSTFAHLSDSELSDYTALNSDLYASNLFAKTGLFVLVKDEHITCIHELKGSSEYVFWFKLDSSFFGRECIVGAAYIASESSVYHDISLFEDVLRDLVNFRSDFNLPILMMGDFNSRTGLLKDFFPGDEFFEHRLGLDALEDTDDSKVDEAHMIVLDIPIKRYNMDKRKVNNNGRRLIDLCKEQYNVMEKF